MLKNFLRCDDYSGIRFIYGTVVRLHQGDYGNIAITVTTRCHAYRITPRRVPKCCIWWI
ncbi:hypothetical protein ACLK19_13580 [Escherichia coli]